MPADCEATKFGTMLRKLASKSFVFLPNVLYALGLLWILLFPAVNITTGEPKPRGLYVDEHALLVQSQLFRDPALQLMDKASADACVMLHSSNVACRQISTASSAIIQVVVIPSKSKLVHEATVLVLRYAPNDACSQQTSTRVAYSLVHHLRHVQWMARNLVILLVPSGEVPDRATSDIDDWLSAHHRPTATQQLNIAVDQVNGRASPDFGLIREAYVMDLAATSGNNCGETGPLFTSLTLHHTGSNGLLPNMDMLAYPLALHSDILIAESATCAAALTTEVTSRLQNLRTQYPTATSLGSIISFLSSTWAEIESSASMRGYRDRLLGLLCSMYAHTSDNTGSLHASFLEYNIDSISVKAEPAVDYSTGADKRGASSVVGRSKQPQRGKRGGPPGVSLQRLVEVALSFVYISNNLQEELHHSHFYYLLMGREHFVGIAEYGFVAGLFLLSLLLLFHQVCARVVYTRILYDATAVLLSLLPIVLCMGWVAPGLATAGTCAAEATCAGGVFDRGAGTAFGRWLTADRSASPALCVLYAYLAGLLCIILVSASSYSGEEIDDAATPTVASQADSSDFKEDSSAPGGPAPNQRLPAGGRMAVLLMLLLVALGWTFARNFSLGAALALAITPTLVTGTYHVLHKGSGLGTGLRTLVLAALAIMHSPLGLAAVDHTITALLHRKGARAYAQAGDLTYPAVMVLNAAASYYAALCLLAHSTPPCSSGE